MCMGEGMISFLRQVYNYDKKEDVVCATPSTSNVLEVRMTEIIISRQEAISQGLTRYFTGKPCPHGHTAQRIVSSYACAECNKIALRKRFIERNDWERERGKKYREKNRDKKISACNAWHYKNKDRAKKYRQDRSYIYRIHAQNRRARIYESGGSFTVEQINSLKKTQKHKCINCKKSIKIDMHIDHIIPIAKGGSNDIKNIQLLCPKCNIKKGKIDPIVWAQHNGRLL